MSSVANKNKVLDPTRPKQNESLSRIFWRFRCSCERHGAQLTTETRSIDSKPYFKLIMTRTFDHSYQHRDKNLPRRQNAVAKCFFTRVLYYTTSWICCSICDASSSIYVKQLNVQLNHDLASFNLVQQQPFRYGSFHLTRLLQDILNSNFCPTKEIFQKK